MHPPSEIRLSWRVNICGLLLVCAWLLAAGCTPTEDGAALFRATGCSHCHRFQGQGGNMGPDLTAVAARRDKKWLRQYITNPAASNPRSRMPGFEQLRADELDAIIAYLKK